MGRFYKSYETGRDLDSLIEALEKHLIKRGYRKTATYYARPLFVSPDAKKLPFLGTEARLRFIRIDKVNDRLVLEAWFLNTYASERDKNWKNEVFVTSLDKNEVDPTDENISRFKTVRKDMFSLLEDITAIIERFNEMGFVEDDFALPSGKTFAYKSNENLSLYIKEDAPKSFRKALRDETVYILLVSLFSLVSSVITHSYYDMANLVLLIALVLISFIKKSYFFSGILFILCALLVILPFFFKSSSNFSSWFLLFFSYKMINTFSKARDIQKISESA